MWHIHTAKSTLHNGEVVAPIFYPYDLLTLTMDHKTSSGLHGWLKADFYMLENSGTETVSMLYEFTRTACCCDSHIFDYLTYQIVFQPECQSYVVNR